MSDVSLVGEKIQQLRSIRRWNWRLGWTVTMRWRGTDDLIAAKITELQASGVEEIALEDEEGPYAVVSGTYPSLQDGTPIEQQIQTIWTRRSNLLEKSIFTLPKSQALTEEVLLEIKNAEARRLSFTEAVANVRKKAAEKGVNVNNAEELLRLIVNEEDAYYIGQYVLRKTRIAPRNSNLKVDDQFVGRIFKTSTLNTQEQIPANLLFTLPAGYWLKMPTDLDQQTDGKWQIIEEWWHADSFKVYTYGSAI